MNSATLQEKLHQLGLSAMYDALDKQVATPAYSKLTFEERLFNLLEAELNARNNRKIKRLLSQAKFKDAQAAIDKLEFSAKRGLDRSMILSLTSCDYIRKHHNIIITGATGVGKSFLAQALAKQAIYEGFSAKYYRVTRILEEIKLARLDGTYTKTLNKIAKFNLIILDDFGVTPLKSDELNDLFEVIEERTLTGSTIVTAQLPITQWHAYLKNETIADAMLDRLIHASHHIEIKGDSMRKILAKNSEHVDTYDTLFDE